MMDKAFPYREDLNYVHIFQNPFCARIPFSLGFYGGQACVASISHLGFLVATWVLDLSMLHSSITDDTCVGAALNWPMDMEPSGPFQRYPSS